MTTPSFVPHGPTPPPPARRGSARRRLWLVLGAILICVGVAVTGTLIAVSMNSPGGSVTPGSSKSSGSQSKELAYRIPSNFCDDRMISRFEDIPGYKPGYSEGFEEREIDVDSEGMSDKARCAARSIDAGVDVYLFDSSEAAGQFYKDNIGSEMHGLDVEDMHGMTWTRAQSGFGIEQSTPRGVVIAQTGQLVVGTSVELESSGSASEADLEKGFGKTLTEIAEAAETACRS